MHATRSTASRVFASLSRSPSIDQKWFALAVGYATANPERAACGVYRVACSICAPVPLAKWSASTSGARWPRARAGTRRIVSSGAPGTVLGGAFAPDSQAALACALPVLPAAGALAVDAPAALDALAAGAGVAVLAGG